MAVATPPGIEIRPFGALHGQARPKRWSMKTRFMAGLAVLTLATAGAFSISALAQTTEETPAPSDQPSAPMEMGIPQGRVAQALDLAATLSEAGAPSSRTLRGWVRCCPQQRF